MAHAQLNINLLPWRYKKQNLQLKLCLATWMLCITIAISYIGIFADKVNKNTTKLKTLTTSLKKNFSPADIKNIRIKYNLLNNYKSYQQQIGALLNRLDVITHNINTYSEITSLHLKNNIFKLSCDTKQPEVLMDFINSMPVKKIFRSVIIEHVANSTKSSTSLKISLNA